MREFLDDPSPQCSVSEGALFAHFHQEETKSDPPGSSQYGHPAHRHPVKSRTQDTEKDQEGEDLDVARNWRPISLICTVAKLYSSLVAKRLMLWTTTEHKLSPEQKGFMPFEGCLEHNFTLQSRIRRATGECAVTWLDLTNAFGSVPHTTIWDTLSNKGLSPGTVARIAEMYRDNRTTYLTQAGLTSEVPISKGVRQGCPLSPIVFNFAIDSMVAKAGACGKDNGYWMYGTGISVLADDLVVVGKSEKDLQLILKGVCDEAQRLGLSFNPKKCASLHVRGKKHDALATRF